MEFFIKSSSIGTSKTFSGGAPANETLVDKESTLTLERRFSLINEFLVTKIQNESSKKRKPLVRTARCGYISAVIKSFLSHDGLSNPELNGLYYALLVHLNDYNIDRFTKFGNTTDREKKEKNIKNAIRFSLVKFPVVGIIGFIAGINWAKVVLTDDSLLAWKPDFKKIENTEYLTLISSFDLENEEEVFEFLENAKKIFREKIKKEKDILPSIIKIYSEFIKSLHPDSTNLKTNIGITINDEILLRIVRGKIILDLLQFRIDREFRKSLTPKCDDYQWLNCFAGIHFTEVTNEHSFELRLTYLDFTKLSQEFIDSEFFLFLYK